MTLPTGAYANTTPFMACIVKECKANELGDMQIVVNVTLNTQNCAFILHYSLHLLKTNYKTQ